MTRNPCDVSGICVDMTGKGSDMGWCYGDINGRGSDASGNRGDVSGKGFDGSGRACDLAGSSVDVSGNGVDTISEIISFCHFLLEQKVTKNSRQKNAAALKPLRTPAFLSTLRTCTAQPLSD
ncbi:MAG: hypothetical protein NTX03_09210 [Bacteroidetes bacterium]|nr:hypothetical protein [Bacteroidota bacterium]